MTAQPMWYWAHFKRGSNDYTSHFTATAKNKRKHYESDLQSSASNPTWQVGTRQETNCRACLWASQNHYIDAKVQEPVAALQALGDARLILARAANSKSMSPLLGGLAPRGQLIVAGAGGDEPISVDPVPLLFGMRSLAGTMTGSSIDAEDTLSFSALQQIRPMIETVPLATEPSHKGRNLRIFFRFPQDSCRPSRNEF